MEYTFNNIDSILANGKLNGQICLVEEKPLPMLDLKKWDDCTDKN